ncbi:MAG TPA: rubrerythrin family protein [Pseudomonadales bacterium]|jgi:rubrerythrin
MKPSESITIKNLESAFAGESMAHMKYLHFAKVCRSLGDDATAKVFEDTAAQEIQHALGHAELLFPKAQLTVAQCLQYAIDGETHEYTEMYPTFRHEAEQEGRSDAVREIDEQIAESREHAQMFSEVLAKAARRFAALAKVEEKHAKHYQQTLNAVNG